MMETDNRCLEDVRPGMTSPKIGIYDPEITKFRCLEPGCGYKLEEGKQLSGTIECPQCSKPHTLDMIKSTDVGPYEYLLFIKLL